METRRPRGRRFRVNQSGQGPLVVVGAITTIIGLVLIVYGVSQLGISEGLGLIAIGAGLLVLDLGGFAVIRTPTVLIGGVPGFVILVIGVIISQIGHV